MSYKNVDIAPLEPYYPGATLHVLAFICVFVCLPLALVLWYMGNGVNDDYDKLSDSEKREYQKKNR